MALVLATVESPDVVTSPVSGARGAVVELEIREGGRTLGAVDLGDILTLRTDEGEAIRLIVRRASLRFDPAEGVTAPLAHPLPEIVPILRRSVGSGDLTVTERVLRKGDRVRLRAFLEGDQVVRDDLEPVIVEVVRFP